MRDVGGVIERQQENDRCTTLQTLTWDGPAGAAAAEVVDNGGITLDRAVDREVGPKPGVGHLLVLERAERGLDGLDGRGAGAEGLYAGRGSSNTTTSAAIWTASLGLGTTHSSQAARWIRSL
jgi:hypothetical protein